MCRLARAASRLLNFGCGGGVIYMYVLVCLCTKMLFYFFITYIHTLTCLDEVAVYTLSQMYAHRIHDQNKDEEVLQKFIKNSYLVYINI